MHNQVQPYLRGWSHVKVNRKHVLAVILILGLLSGIAQPLVSLSKGQTSSLTVDNSYWLRLATNAWNYFQPGVGVDPTTGLHYSGAGYPYFTDWDLGLYIQAIIGVNQLGILGTDGVWGATDRFDKVLTFLENRALASNGVPYVWYGSNGDPATSTAQDIAQNPYDPAELLIALNNLRTFRPDLANRVNSIVYTRTNYAPLEQEVNGFPQNSKGFYDFYAASGFACFWPQFSALASSVLNNIVSAPTVSTYGVNLPIATINSEPLQLSVYSLPHNAQLENLAYLVNSAEQARYVSTGKFTAFSEGSSDLSVGYVYEDVVFADGSTWFICDTNFNRVDIVPIVYFKAAVGLLAMYDSPFTENMASYVESQLPTPTGGYDDGVDENGRVLTWTVGDTNAMIILSAQYAFSGSPPPSPTPTASPTPSPSPSPTPTASSTPSPSPSLSPSPTPTASPTPSPSPSLTLSPTPTPTRSVSPTANPTLIPTTSPSSTHNSNASPTSSFSSAPSGSPITSSPSKSSTPNTRSTPLASATVSGFQNAIQLITEPLYYVPIGVALTLFVVLSVVYLKRRH